MKMSHPIGFASWLAQTSSISLIPSIVPSDTSLPLLIIGAGPAGLAMMQSCQESQIPYQCVESSTDVGGLWATSNEKSPAYDALISNSSKYTTYLQSYPMSKETPNHVPRAVAAKYLSDFANHHQLRPKILFESSVTSIHKDDKNRWKATLVNHKNSETSESYYRAVVIAAGTQSKSTAKLPHDLAAMAEANGIHYIHSSSYRNPAAYENKNVVVVGLGNSASEIATEVSRVSKSCTIAVRTTPWIVPLTFLSTPSDVVAARSKGLPHSIQMFSLHCLQRITCGHPTSLGFPKPDHDLLERLPVIDRGIVAAIKNKRIKIAKTIAAIKDKQISFTGQEKNFYPVDEIIFATGYHRRYSFLPKEYGDLEDPSFHLMLQIFHPNESDLFILPELVAPQGAWPTFSNQAKAITAYLLADSRQDPRLAQFNALRSLPAPDYKGHLFKVADNYHIDPHVYNKLLTDFIAWINKEQKKN